MATSKISKNTIEIAKNYLDESRKLRYKDVGILMFEVK